MTNNTINKKITINHPLNKNIINTFHQPKTIIYHTPFLQSLPKKK
ncbi:hypothetical protein [Klebsiella pneumoniae]